MRKTLCILLAAALLLALTGCQKADTSIEPADDPSPDAAPSETDHVHHFEQLTSPATCTKMGFVFDHCTECDAAFVAEELPAPGHDYKDGVCTRCGEADPDYTPPAQPDPEPTTTPDPEPTTKPDPEPTTKPDPEPTTKPDPEPTTKPDPEPTTKPDPEPAAHVHTFEKRTSPADCTKGGYEFDYCAACGASFVAKELPALGHDFVDGACTRCGAADPDYTATPAPPYHEHCYETIERTNATCTEDGVATDVCTICGISYVYVLRSSGHSYSDGICSKCGEKDPNASFVTVAGQEYVADTWMLSLHDRNLTNKDLEDIKQLTELISLNVGGNKITDISALAGLTQLTKLILSRNTIRDISALSGMTDMTELVLGHCGITDISALAGMTKLTYLNLGCNSISDISVLANMTELITLNLEVNNISDISVLKGLTKLERLTIFGNPLSQAQIDELQAALPYCGIHF